MFILRVFVKNSMNIANSDEVLVCSSNKSRLEELKADKEKKEQLRQEVINYFNQSYKELIKINPRVCVTTLKLSSQNYFEWVQNMYREAFDMVVEKFGTEILEMFPSVGFLEVDSQNLVRSYYIDEIDEL